MSWNFWELLLLVVATVAVIIYSIVLWSNERITRAEFLSLIFLDLSLLCAGSWVIILSL